MFRNIHWCVAGLQQVSGFYGSETGFKHARGAGICVSYSLYGI